MPTLFHLIKHSPVRNPGIRKVSDVMRESRYVLRVARTLKARLCAQVLTKRMKLTNKKPSACNQHARRFSENEIEIFDVFEHQIADDQIE